MHIDGVLLSFLHTTASRKLLSAVALFALCVIAAFAAQKINTAQELPFDVQTVEKNK